MATAKVLAKHGYVVRFIKKSEEYKTKTADAYVDGEQWEFKSPEGSRLVSIERCLRRAKNQSGNIIFDSRRMKNMPDAAIVREILAKAPLIKGIKKIKYIDRRGTCVDIFMNKR